MYFDVEGHPVFGRDFANASGFLKGFATVGEADRVGVIDRTGQVVMPIRYQAVWLPADDASPTMFKQNGKWEIIGKSGGTTFLTAAEIDEPFSCGRAIVNEGPNGPCHFIDAHGRKLFGRSFWRAERFVLDRAVVQAEDGGEHKWIDLDGKTVFQWEMK